MAICNLGEENAVTTKGQEYSLWSHRNTLQFDSYDASIILCYFTKNIKLQT